MDRKKLLDELESEHKRIMEVLLSLGKVVEKQTVDDVAAVRKDLANLEDLLKVHISKEDDLFYPDLKLKAEEMKQGALIPALNFFMNSMHEVSEKARDFFDSFRDDDSITDDIDRFVTRLDSLNMLLMKRIKSEEGSLFYLYKAYYFDE